ncbi:tRNA lysidine(34) synthetase TilS [Janthinobacterium fluminis]|uniref:tRNA(Ile)-lysidine synthase n=1 Tax=Janthinobacterium fluminis TaxID=2987524 RepID=A0ABT5K1K7_9BURK|nr:tRNA lysidine(34) synthetase TilS [Janthinobacterium fluminis]MDC8758320.1 tRNA lysidine(34) synthetase TilS [Janthinobacterium fluminis]
MKKQQTGSLADTFEHALAACRQRAGATGPLTGMAIALSGGLDSSALLHLAHAYARGQGIALHAFHIHHGISPHADAWLAHCEAACAALGVPFEARRVTLERSAKTGTEAAARNSRYAALGQLCREHGVRLLLTAHHQDDQAETVLLQLLRGSGTAGLSGMDAANAAPELLGNPELLMARPLLPASRKQLAAYVAAHAIAYVDDESNADPRFARNALRHQVMPALAQAFPGFQERFARSAQHAQSAQRLLVELATQDLALCLDGDCLDIGKLRLLSTDRCYNLLRHWFGTRALRMPSTAWLAEMLAQLLEARPDAQLLVTHPDCHVRRHRERLFLTPKLAELAGTRDDDDDASPGQGFVWRGEAELAFPAYGGVLYFDQAEEGVDAAWLRGQSLVIDFRKGGERLKLAANRPTKTLKYHYQAFDVPAWERERLPTVGTATQLLFAAGIGMDCHQLSEAAAPRIRLRWISC